MTKITSILFFYTLNVTKDSDRMEKKCLLYSLVIKFWIELKLQKNLLTISIIPYTVQLKLLKLLSKFSLTSHVLKSMTS